MKTEEQDILMAFTRFLSQEYHLDLEAHTEVSENEIIRQFDESYSGTPTIDGMLISLVFEFFREPPHCEHEDLEEIQAIIEETALPHLVTLESENYRAMFWKSYWHVIKKHFSLCKLYLTPPKESIGLPLLVGSIPRAARSKYFALAPHTNRELPQNIVCPECGSTSRFDISACDGCEGDIREVRCWNCGHDFDPRTEVDE
jgi:rubredoxin